MENAICILLGREPDKIACSTFDLQPVPEQRQAGVAAQLLSRRPDVQQAELDFRSAFELTNVARANFYPSVTLNSGSMVGVAATGFTNFFSLENLIANVIGGLMQPVFNRGKLKGNLETAKAQQEIAPVTFKNTVLKAGREVSDILFSYQSSIKKNAVWQEQINSTQKAVEYTPGLLKAGEANYTEVLTAEQNYLLAQLARVSDKPEQLQYLVNLYRALGGGRQVKSVFHCFRHTFATLQLYEKAE